MKTNELTGAALDWAVAQAELELERNEDCSRYIDHRRRVMWERGDLSWWFKPSTDWSQGGPIIEREKIQILPRSSDWVAVWFGPGKPITGPTPLIAAMRCYVASKLGDDIDLPKELT